MVFRLGRRWARTPRAPPPGSFLGWPRPGQPRARGETAHGHDPLGQRRHPTRPRRGGPRRCTDAHRSPCPVPSRLKQRRGSQRAAVAVAHAIIRISVVLLTRTATYGDLGPDGSNVAIPPTPSSSWSASANASATPSLSRRVPDALRFGHAKTYFQDNRRRIGRVPGSV